MLHVVKGGCGKTLASIIPLMDVLPRPSLGDCSVGSFMSSRCKLKTCVLQLTYNDFHFCDLFGFDRAYTMDCDFDSIFTYKTYAMCNMCFAL